MPTKDSIPAGFKRIITLFAATILVFSAFTLAAFAEPDKIKVSGRVYEFDQDNDYEFSNSKDFVASENAETYGTFSIRGEIADVTTKNGVPAYEVANGNLNFFYNHGDHLLNASEDSWHLVSDKSKKIDHLKLDENILKGAIILQTSIDRLNWVDAICITDAFNKFPTRGSSIYESIDIQLINGCYYRAIIAYELRIRTGESEILFINTDEYDYKKYAEVYEFYAYTDTDSADAGTSEEIRNLGSKLRVADSDSYSGETTITKDDMHYGWDLGYFYVSGYTAEVQKSSDDKAVFLKNVGDKVTLGFRLNQNINKLNGNEKLSITADRNGSDQYFETPDMDFGRGTLIIRHTDYQNAKSEPVIYTNYLEAYTSINADTKVWLCEEGDYEVALDYQISEDRLFGKPSHYRIFFKFSIRNGNCMVYPFDVASGSELTNSSMTENGFRLDLAKSRYLKINLKREMLTESADGLVEDIRFNGPARDGAEYTDEGIYTITVTNEYTGQFTVKKIYVGTNNVLKAYMTTGLSIPEINDLVNRGATIADDGTIQLANTAQATNEPAKIEETTAPTATPESPVEAVSADVPKALDDFLLPIIVAVGACVLCIVILLVSKKRRKSKASKKKEHTEGGMEE